MRIYSEQINRVKTSTLINAINNDDFVIIDGDIHNECYILNSNGSLYGCKSWGGISTIWKITNESNKNKRIQVRIRDKVVRVDNLVAQHFLPPKPEDGDKWELYHINGLVGDNRSENLGWRRLKDRRTTTPLQEVQKKLSELALQEELDDVKFS